MVSIGIGGGLVPCPAAILLMLFAWQINAPGLGLLCLIAFSVGLAISLITVGLLAVSGASLVIRWATRKKEADQTKLLLSFVTMLGGVALIICGTIMFIFMNGNG